MKTLLLTNKQHGYLFLLNFLSDTERSLRESTLYKYIPIKLVTLQLQQWLFP